MVFPVPENIDAQESAADDRKRVVKAAFKVSDSVQPQPGSVDFLAPLENSVPLGAPRVQYVISSNPSTLASTDGNPSQPISLPIHLTPAVDESNQPNPQPSLERLGDRCDQPQSPLRIETRLNLSTLIVSEEIIPLLEERLVVDRRQRKVGEVVVRKEIETQIVEVPIRREKLIVEQISPEYKQLAVVDLGQAQVTERDVLEAVDTTLAKTVKGRFTSANAAIQFLEAIKAQSNSGRQTVQVSVVLSVLS